MRAFIFVEKPYKDDDYNSVSVLQDLDSKNTLIHEIEDGGDFDLAEYVDDISEIKTGYYWVNYDWHLEQESWEMPHIEYPVINEWDMKKCWYGWFYAKWLCLVLFATRANRYGY